MSEPPAGDRDPNEWLTVEQVSRELSVHQVTVRDWLNRGLLVGSKAGRRRWRVRREALDEFLGRGDPAEVDVILASDPYTAPTGFAANVIDTLSSQEESS
jgi:excisionase family DNA binding protein